MVLKFSATLDVSDYKKHNITKSDDLFCIRYDSAYRDKIRAELRKITEKNAKNLSDGKDPVQLDITVDIHYKKRSLDQNSWLWMAHELEARIVNTKDQTWRDEHGITWYKPGAITSEEIHESYMERFAPRATILVDPDNVEYLRRMLTETTGRVVSETWIPQIGKMEFIIWKTSSYMNVAEFCQLAEKVKESLLSYGVDLDSAGDYKNLIDGLETIKSLQKVPGNDTCEREKEELIKLALHSTLTKQNDLASIVKEVFKGETIRQDELDIY